MSREGTLKAIDAEREYQVGKWGDEFDSKNTINDWVSYLTRYAGMASNADDKEHFQTLMVKVAAIAVAAVEASEKGGLPPRHYDEPVNQCAEPVLKFSDLPPAEGLTLGDLSDEVFRTYDFGGRAYRIVNPIGVYYRPGGTTHRVVDSSGETHCVPAPGFNGCVLRWQSSEHPVAW